MPATDGFMVKAVLVSYDSVGFLATVRPLGAGAGPAVAGVPVSRLFAATGGAAEMVAGRTVVIAQFSEADPTDACVVAVYVP